MHSLAALLLATPVFGFSLQPPSIEPIVDLAAYSVVADLGAVASPVLLASADSASETQARAKQAEEADYKAQVERRNSLTAIHRPLGIATWAAMTVAEVLGFIQYYNKYGFFADQGSNPCVKGTAIFGQGQCIGTPWPHLVAAGLTTGLYAATFTVSLMMPDPDDLANARGEFASTLRMHKILRWVHFGGMVAQVLLGIVIANGSTYGLSRANDYKTLQALATVHLASGLVTYGALSWAGALMTF
jgi:hypothetical protein